MTRWERLEEYLFDHDKEGTTFQVNDYVDEVGLESGAEGSQDIQSYLRAQRTQPRKDKKGRDIPGTGSKTLYVLHRVPKTRTSTSKWSVGARTKNARLIGRTLADDTQRRVHRAFMPDLIRLRKLNPRAAKQVEAQINAVIGGAMVILAAAAEGMQAEDEE